MSNNTFSSPFKPDGKDYIKLCMWNRYIHNYLRLIITFIPCVLGIFFLVKGGTICFLPVYILMICYPFFNVVAFLIKILKHLKFRSKADTTIADYTFLENGILTERKEVEIYHLYHWDEFNRLIDFSKYLLLYKNNRLILILQKEPMKKAGVKPAEVKEYIINHLM